MMHVTKKIIVCDRCKDQGFYFRLPEGMNPFAASIEVTCREMRRIKCDCGGPALPRAERVAK